MTVDLKILRDYLNHDEKMVQKFIQLFCDAVPTDMSKLKTYIDEGQTEMMQITAHAIKSQCAYLGLEECRTLALRIEESNQTGNGEKAIATELENNILSVVSELKMTLRI